MVSKRELWACNEFQFRIKISLRKASSFDLTSVQCYVDGKISEEKFRSGAALRMSKRKLNEKTCGGKSEMTQNTSQSFSWTYRFQLECIGIRWQTYLTDSIY